MKIVTLKTPMMSSFHTINLESENLSSLWIKSYKYLSTFDIFHYKYSL